MLVQGDDVIPDRRHDAVDQASAGPASGITVPDPGWQQVLWSGPGPAQDWGEILEHRSLRGYAALRPALRRPSKVLSKALSAAFHLLVRNCPRAFTALRSRALLDSMVL